MKDYTVAVNELRNHYNERDENMHTETTYAMCHTCGYVIGHSILCPVVTDRGTRREA